MTANGRSTRAGELDLVSRGGVGDFRYWPDAVDENTNSLLCAWLDTIPVLDWITPGSARGFTFVEPRSDGQRVVGRAEACAGDPVWIDNHASPGPAVPPQLGPLLRLVNAIAQETFTSIYVDRYPPGGRFVAHTDRSCYGAVIAGVSLGTGTSSIKFTDGDDELLVKLEARSLYRFSGPLRFEPWTHSVDQVTGSRYGVTFRSARANEPTGSSEQQT